MVKLRRADVIRDLKALYKRVDAKIARYGELSEGEIRRIVQGVRKRSG